MKRNSITQEENHQNHHHSGLIPTPDHLYPHIGKEKDKKRWPTTHCNPQQSHHHNPFQIPTNHISYPPKPTTQPPPRLTKHPNHPSQPTNPTTHDPYTIQKPKLVKPRSNKGKKKKKKLREVNQWVVLTAGEIQSVMSGADEWIGGR